MNTENLTVTADLLAKQIAAASSSGRLRLQPKLSRVLEKLAAEGQPVPGRLRRLDAALIDEVIEARFDNMPV